MIEFKGSHFERDVILWAVRWYVAYPISYRQLEEMMEEHGVEVDHATLNRWVLKYVPLLDQEFRGNRLKPGGGMDPAGSGRPGERDEVAGDGGVERERWDRPRARGQRGRKQHRRMLG